MSLFQVSSRSVSGRCTCFRDDVVAFGLCVCLVCFRYVRGLCRVGLCVFVAMSLRWACVCRVCFRYERGPVGQMARVFVAMLWWLACEFCVLLMQVGSRSSSDRCTCLRSDVSGTLVVCVG